MKLTMRAYRDENDYWCIRQFLRQLYQLTAPLELNWQAYRFDYWRWHGVLNCGHGVLETDVFLWETAGDELVAVLNREGPREAFLQVHPNHRTAELEEQMIEVAEEHLAHTGPDGKRTITLWSNPGDELRPELLARRGFAQADWQEYKRRRTLNAPILEAPPPPGYVVRSLGDGAELLERSYASGRAFHPDNIQQAVENRDDVTWYRNIQTAPLYRRDLDLVVVAPSGAVASFCTIWFDDVNRTGAFEPVGTVPEYQRRGLGKVVMCEGLRRLKRIGARMAYVGSYNAPAHALYASVGFTEYDLGQPWVKEFQSE